MNAGGRRGVETIRPVVVNAGEMSLAALRAGDDGAPNVLLIPGYAGSKQDFVEVMPLLAVAGFRITAIDLPGQYESLGPAEWTEYTTDALGRIVASVALDFGSPIHLVGQSFGGLVARAAALAAPSSFVDLVLLSSGPSALGGVRGARITRIQGMLSTASLASVWDAIQAELAATPGHVPEPAEVLEPLRRQFLAGNPAALIGMAAALASEQDRVEELRATAIRSLVLWGEGDDAWPPAVQEDMARRLGATTAVIELSAHAPIVENPQATAAALTNFWRG